MVDIPIQRREVGLIIKFLRKRNLLNSLYAEVGCGDGSNLKVFSKNKMKGYGIDISPMAIEILKKKDLPNTSVIKYDFLKFNKKVDLVFMLNILEHVGNYIEFINKGYEILNNNGFLIICVPVNPNSFGYADRNAGHVRRFCERELLNKLKSRGFRNIEVLHVGFPVSDFYTYLFNLLNKNKKVKPQNLYSGIRYKKNYYPGIFDILSKILFPILVYLIKIDMFFSKTKLGNNVVVFCQK